ncbi:MAG: hypothetical protein E2O78_06580 [Caldithrix sp.]|nr:MAG: hypothetical protein E2O78_06580 [Caldithrix sp.]
MKIASNKMSTRHAVRFQMEIFLIIIGAIASVVISSSATLFFDDTVENVEGARLAGLQAVHVRTPLDVKRALVDIGAL